MTILFDDFDRANSATVGNGWVDNLSGPWSIAGGQLAMTTVSPPSGFSVGRSHMLFRDPSEGTSLDQRYRFVIDWTDIDTNSAVAVFARHQAVALIDGSTSDENTGYMVALRKISSTETRVEVWTCVENSASLIYNDNQTMPSTGRFVVDFEITGSSPTTIAVTVTEENESTPLHDWSTTNSLAALQVAGRFALTAWQSGGSTVSASFDSVELAVSEFTATAIVLQPELIGQSQALADASQSARHAISPEPVDQAQTASEPALELELTLGVDEIVQAQALADASLSEGMAVSAEGIDQLQALAAAGVSAVHVLSPEGVLQAQAIGDAPILQADALQPDGLSQLQLLADAGVSAVHVLTPADVEQLQDLGEASTLQTGALQPASLVQGQTLGDAFLAAFRVSVSPAGLAQSQHLRETFVSEGAMLLPVDVIQVQDLSDAEYALLLQLLPEALAQAQELGAITLSLAVQDGGLPAKSVLVASKELVILQASAIERWTID